MKEQIPHRMHEDIQADISVIHESPHEGGGGAGLATARHAEALNRRGFTTRLVCPTPHISPGDGHYGEIFPPEFPYATIDVPRTDKGKIIPAEELLTWAKRGPQFEYYLRIFESLEGKPWFANYWTAGGLAIEAQKHAAINRPVVVMNHSAYGRYAEIIAPNQKDWRGSERKKVEESMPMQADATIVATEVERELVEHYYGAKGKVYTVPLFINHQELNPPGAEQLRRSKRRELLPGITDKTQILYTLGRIAPGKGPDTSIKAVSLMLEDDPHLDIVLAIIGPISDQKYYERMKQFIQEQSRKNPNLTRHIRFLGPQPKVVAHQIGDIHLNLSELETFGYVQLEAMGTKTHPHKNEGKPTITSDVPMMAEVGGSHAIIVDPENTDQLARTIEEMIHNPHLRQANGVDNFKQSMNYTPEKSAMILEHTLKTIEHRFQKPFTQRLG